MYKLFPSHAWELYVSLQVMHQSSLYAPSETMVTLFYEDSSLYQVPGRGCGETWESDRVAYSSSPGPAFPLQLVYLVNKQQSQLIKRPVPVEQLLMYQQLSRRYLLPRQR